VVGFALFGSVTYLPLFLQVVNRATPTGSGLQILPLMAGLLITSISSGQIISRTGRYRAFPIAGTLVMAIGLSLLSTMNAHTGRLEASGYMFVLGLGLGMVMQVLVLAVQNAVDYKDLGVATSGATLFRSIGGAVGTAVLGSIFSNRLTSELASSLPASARSQLGAGGSVSLNTAKLDKLPPAIHTIYTTAFTNALSTVFVVAAGVAAVAFALSWLLEQRPLRDTVVAGSGIGESFAVPKDTDSLAEAARGLTVLIGRDERRRLVERLAERAGVNLSAAASWLIVRLHEDPAADIPSLCRAFDLPVELGERALTELVSAGLVSVTQIGPGQPAVRTVSTEGATIAERLIEERRASLARLCEDWSPDQHDELGALLTNLARELAGEPTEEMRVPAPA
jgi:hypothetical protein